MFDNGNGSSPRSANLSFSYHCDKSSPAVTNSSIERLASTTPAVTTSSIEHSASTTPAVTTSSIEPSVSTVISMICTNIITTPSPTPINCSTDGIWPETLPGHNVTGSYCYKGTVNVK